MKRVISFILVFAVAISCAFAQQVTIKGKVVSAASKTPIQDANISLMEQGRPFVVAFATSDKQGEYSITYKGSHKKITLSVSGFNLKTQSKNIDAKNQTLDFMVEEEQIELKEVIVQAPKIRQSGDTLNYNVAHFTGQEDRSIADVLKKMPGIEVRSDGTVLYQNRSINKFYIENLDMLQGRYGIATNNISAKDVATVQVMENHQPVKALIGKEFVNEAALNLKLKESAKGAFFLTAQIGVGASPLLLSNELLGMYFTRNMQHLSMYKGDNTGRDVTQELQSLYITSSDNVDVREMIRAVTPPTPTIPQQRHLFNDANAATVNNLNTLGENYTLTTNLNYVYDNIDKEAYSFSEYYLPNNEVVRIEETMSAMGRKNTFDAAFNLKANTDTYYLSNDLKLSGAWKTDATDIISNQAPIHQQVKTPSYSATNFFDLVKTKGKRTYKAQSFIGYKDIQQDLIVTPSTLEDVFKDNAGGSDVQTLNRSAFETRNRISWSTTGRFSLDYSARLNASLQKLSSQLKASDRENYFVADSLQNSISRDYLEGVFSIGTGYHITPTMNIRATLPLRYLHLWRGGEKKISDSFVYLDPHMMFNWQLTARWSSNLMYNLSHIVGGIEKDYTNPILMNYRMLMRNDNVLEKTRNQSVIWFLGYKNPFTTFFGSFNLFYNHNRSNLLSEYNYSGVFTRRASIEQANTSESLSSSLSFGKEIDVIKSNVSLRTSYSGSWSEQISQSQIVGLHTRSFSVSPRIITKLGSLATAQYAFTYSQMQSKMDIDTEKLPLMETFSQKMSLNTFPTSKMVVSLRCDYFQNSSMKSEDKTMWFGDIGVKYKMRRIELLLDWNNVFNTSSYVVSSYAETGRYFHSYQLRPSEVLLRVRFNIL